MAHLKAYSLLSSQPASIQSCSQSDRDNIVISAVMDGNGDEVVISRYGDDLWDMWPFFDQSNLTGAAKSFNWLKISDGFRPACKAAIYRYWCVGIPGAKRPAAVSVMRVLHSLAIFTKYLTLQRLSCLSDVRPIHVSNFVHEQREIKRLSPNTLVKNFLPLELLYRFSKEHTDGMTFHPWPESSYFDIAGMSGDARRQESKVSKTPLIPKPVAQTLFRFAEKTLKDGARMLDERDAGLRRKYRDTGIKLLRDSCFYLLGVLTGMRCEELVGIEINAERTEVKDGVTYHWIASTEHKTFKGRVEYMMPSMGHEILKIMERLSAPLRLKLKDEISKMESGAHVAMGADLEKILARARADENRIFLSVYDGCVIVPAAQAWGASLKNLAKLAGTNWTLAAHQMRRLYAWTFVRHKLGDLLFLKEQFKHSSIDMSQLYAANPNQDLALYQEIFEEFQSQKADIIEEWLSDERPLAGGAGIKIMRMRAHDFPNRSALIQETSVKLNVRSTGHGWCLAQDDGCGGQGLYEKGLCVDCGSGVIDQSFKSVWDELYSHQSELLLEVDELGPGATERVQRDLSRTKRVLNALGGDIK